MPASSNIQIGIALRGSIKKKGTEKRVYSVQLWMFLHLYCKETNSLKYVNVANARKPSLQKKRVSSLFKKKEAENKCF